jgi:hypothetical protein
VLVRVRLQDSINSPRRHVSALCDQSYGCSVVLARLNDVAENALHVEGYDAGLWSFMHF